MTSQKTGNTSFNQRAHWFGSSISYPSATWGPNICPLSTPPTQIATPTSVLFSSTSYSSRNLEHNKIYIYICIYILANCGSPSIMPTELPLITGAFSFLIISLSAAPSFLGPRVSHVPRPCASHAVGYPGNISSIPRGPPRGPQIDGCAALYREKKERK